MNEKGAITLRRLVVTAFVLAVAAFAVSMALRWTLEEAPGGDASVPVVSDFASCASAGYPVMESYPRRCATPDGRSFAEDIGNEMGKSDLIRISTPRPNSVVTNPLVIAGEARGFWFFEADFPMRLIDEQGDELSFGVATAQGEWMTENFVPFSGELSFAAPSSQTGTLILEKDNPSGLPEHEDALRVPVRFGP